MWGAAESEVQQGATQGEGRGQRKGATYTLFVWLKISELRKSTPRG